MFGVAAEQKNVRDSTSVDDSVCIELHDDSAWWYETRREER